MLTQNALRLSSVLGLVLTSTTFGKVALLEEVRKELQLPAYTSAERTLLAKQAEFFISSLYVHRDLKIKDFGSGVDPVPRLTNLVEKAGELSNEAFHSTISTIFHDLRDLHTNYMAPTPLSCAAAFVPLRFQGVLDGSRSVVVVGKKLKVNEDLIKDIAIGDELLTIDGEAADAVAKKMMAVSGGANEDAMKARAIQLLSFRNGTNQALPEKNSVVLKLKGASGEYEKTVPWSAFVDDDCASNRDGHRGRFRMDLMHRGVDEYQRRFNKIFTPARPLTDDTTWFGEESLKDVYEVALLNTPAGKIGYVRLKSFHWDNRNLDIPTVIDSLRGEIEKNLSPAAGLVIDVRGNPGGYIVLAEKLVQLFSSRVVEPTTVRMLANKLNEDIFLRANGSENRWTDAIRNALNAGNRYTEPLAITPVTEANSFGQVWFRPVVVLTDASCFSACDLFSAGMQDAKAGVVIGLHKQTGAGGANVMEYSTFRSVMGAENNPFKELPYNQNMRVSWRQTLRAGLHKGELIENAGVMSDVVIPLTKKDVTDGESKTLMAEVHKRIDLLTPKYKSGLEVRRGSSILFENGKSARWTEKVYGIDAVEYFVADKKVSSQTVKFSPNPENFEFSVDGLSAEWSDVSLVIVGTRRNEQVFRVVRELMWRGAYTEIPEDGLKIDFSSNDVSPFRTVLLKGAPGSGWQVVDGKLRVGKGPKYEPRVFTRANLPVKLNGKGATLKLDISLVAEDLNDSLRIYAINPDTGDRSNLFAGSEIRPKIGAKIPLPTDWQRADVVFEFESDENWNMTGPIVDNVQILQ